MKLIVTGVMSALLLVGCKTTSTKESRQTDPGPVETNNGHTVSADMRSDKEKYLSACLKAMKHDRNRDINCHCSYTIATNKLKNSRLDLMTARMNRDEEAIDRLKKRYGITDEMEKAHAVKFVKYTSKCIRRFQVNN